MAKGKNFFAYFTTQYGQKLVFMGATCTAIALFAGNFVPHTILLNKYREIVQCYSSGIERPIPEKVLKRLDIAYDKLNLHNYERKLIKPFTVYGFDVFQAGSIKYRFGAILGIPVNYSFESEDDINKQDIRFRNELINWDSEMGKLLQESIILKEDEQIFGLCRAILQLQTHYILLNSLFPTGTFLFIYTVGNVLNQKLNLLVRPLSLRVMMYSILSLFGIGVWSFLKDFTQVQYDSYIDKKLCELGPEFIDAGIRFYDRILKKNIALRGLTGDNSIYTAKGNENYFLRQKSMPLTIRKSYFEMRMEELQKQLNNPNVTS